MEGFQLEPQPMGERLRGDQLLEHLGTGDVILVLVLDIRRQALVGLLGISDARSELSDLGHLIGGEIVDASSPAGF